MPIFFCHFNMLSSNVWKLERKQLAKIFFPRWWAITIHKIKLKYTRLYLWPVTLVLEATKHKWGTTHYNLQSNNSNMHGSSEEKKSKRKKVRTDIIIDINYKILKSVCEDHNCPITQHNEWCHNGLFRWFRLHAHQMIPQYI